MTRQVSEPIELTRAVVRAIQSDRITFIAASLAYYAFISLLPLMLLGLVVVSTVGGPELAESVGEQVAASFGEEGQRLVVDALTNAAGRGGATVVGVAVLLWSGLKLFRGMDVAFSTVYGTATDDSILDQLRDASVTLVAVGLGVVATLVVGIATAERDQVIAGIDLFNVLGSVVLLAGLTAAFLPLYYVLPARGLSVREALPGAVFAAVGWVLLTTGFRIYAGMATSYQAYGILGGVLLLVTFLYFGGLILLVGVVLNAVLGGRIDEETDLDLPEEHREAVDRPETALEDDGEQLSGRDAIGGIDVGDDEELESQVRDLREELAEMEAEMNERTVPREEVERDLERYVRSRVRRGKARGWGPYLVLLYGTAMTLGAFYFLSGGWAILAMLVIWLSTLGLYVLMLLVGTVVGTAGLPGKLKDRVDEFRG